MIKETKYNGCSAAASDYQAADGDLSFSLGVIPEDGALKPILQPVVILHGNDGIGECIYIHKGNQYEHFICFKDSVYWWHNRDDSMLTSIAFDIKDCINVAAVGNTLIFLTESGMRYFLWKENDGFGTYKDLGTHLPELPLTFGLQGEMVRSDVFHIDFDEISEDDIWKEFSDDNKTKISNQVLAKVNKFIAEQSVNKGRFIYPFFIRYAYRLYDGSLTMHSSPILMIASSDLAPQVFFDYINGHGAYTDADLRVVAMTHRVDYAVANAEDIVKLEQWKDIIRSVDIFCSKPIYTYDQNGKCQRFAKSDDTNSYCVCKHINQALSQVKYPLRYQYHTFNKLYAFTYSPHSLSYPTGRLMLPRRSVDAVKQDIKECSQFYLLDSVKLDALTTARTLLNVTEDYLQSLLNREAMTDDYDSHDTLIPKYAFNYNSRINIANIDKVIFSGYNVASMFCFTNGYVDNFEQPAIYNTNEPYSVYIYIKQDGRDIVVECDSFKFSFYRMPMLFIYYPNINAYKAVIVRWYGMPYVKEVQLEQHAFLNGAFFFGGWDIPTLEQGDVPDTSSYNERTVNLPNKIYTSEVNNPFYFPTLGVNTVGTGNIVGICAAVKALSQGQFGQFPLYAFTTEGVWALEVSATGTYSARQPVTRDVCTNHYGITQLDSAVLFPTDRGIMLISGSQTQCISENIDSEYTVTFRTLPAADKIIEAYNRLDDSDNITPADTDIIPFRTFLLNCRMLYDYNHQRVVVYNHEHVYAYVYSLQSKQWGMMTSKLKASLNSYPEALAINMSNDILDFSSYSGNCSKALVVTRPFKLGEPDIHKTIDTVIQRGTFQHGHIAQVLYASNTLLSWHIVWSSRDEYMRGFRGTPYKYFRLAVIALLQQDESITAFTTQYTPRLTNQPR